LRDRGQWLRRTSHWSGVSRSVHIADRLVERAHLRSTGKVFGGKQLVAFGFQSVGHVGGRKSRERVLSVFGGISSRERKVKSGMYRWCGECVVDRLL